MTPLYDALKQHLALNRSSFHTPGHKNNGDALPSGLWKLDFTELPDTGSLFDNSGPFPETEALAAKWFGATRTCLSAGGCTLCIQAMLRLAAPHGGKIVCSRVLHRSAVNAMALLGLEPVWALPENLPVVIENTPQAKAVYVTSPNYYGQLLDIPALAVACRKTSAPLLVDCAHGAHLSATEPMLHPLRLGADITADSAHKTLGVLTGGAWLNIRGERFAEDAKQSMALFGSTSPSFPVLASLDLCREWLQKQHGEFSRVQNRISDLRELALSRGIALPRGLCDPTRLTLGTASIGLPGTRAAEIFRRRGVEPEYADATYVVFIATPFNTDEDFVRLEQAVRSLPAGTPLAGGPALPALPPVKMTLREAVLAPSETVPLDRARGRIAAEAACPCPPGVPVSMPGEEITKEIVEFLYGYGFLEIKVIK